MRKYNEYCQLLGVSPGDSAEVVQQKFRARIKECHPDSTGNNGDQSKAQLLIEAYSAFKEGVPSVNNTSSIANGSGKKARKAYTSTRQKGYMSGMRMFEQIFANSRNKPVDFHLGSIFAKLHQELYAENEDDAVWEYKPSKAKSKQQTSDSKDYSGASQYQRAEMVLQSIVHKYERTKRRFAKRWAYEFIGELTQAQVLYRDVCNAQPGMTYKALYRVRQINELIQEIRSSAKNNSL